MLNCDNGDVLVTAPNDDDNDNGEFTFTVPVVTYSRKGVFHFAYLVNSDDGHVIDHGTGFDDFEALQGLRKKRSILRTMKKNILTHTDN